MKLTTELGAVTCDDFSANRCDPGGRLPVLVELAVHSLVRNLVARVEILPPPAHPTN